MSITIRHLAQQLNLSVSTVSKALRDSREISSETKERVLLHARKLNYIPNPYASSLRGKKSNTIAVIIPEVADSFFSGAIKGIESVAQEKGYHTLIYLTYESSRREQAILHDITSGRVDGVLLSVASETVQSEHIREVEAQGVPVVFFDRVQEEVQTASVTTNDYESGYAATQHLIERGCRNIAILSISSSLSISDKRIEGYHQALKDHGLQGSGPGVIPCCNDEGENRERLHRLLTGAQRPDGVVATVEKLITPLYLACQEAGLPIPGAVKIIGFSTLPSAPILHPPLTTITQPAFEMGRAAAATLFRALEKSGFDLKHERIVLPSTLIVRGSTG